MTSTLSVMSLEAKKLRVGQYSMWFTDNKLYCSDGSNTYVYDITGGGTIVPYDPTKDTAILPYDNDGVIAYKEQTIYDSLLDILTTVISNFTAIEELKTQIADINEYDPTKDMALLPYYDYEGKAIRDKVQTIYQSLYDAIVFAMNSGGGGDVSALKETCDNVNAAMTFSDTGLELKKNLTIGDKIIAGFAGDVILPDPTPEEEEAPPTELAVRASELPIPEKLKVRLMTWEYYESHKSELKGEKGDKGDDGLRGPQGEPGSKANSWLWSFINTGLTGATFLILQDQIDTLWAAMGAQAGAEALEAAADVAEEVGDALEGFDEVVDEIETQSFWGKILNYIKQAWNKITSNYQQIADNAANIADNQLHIEEATAIGNDVMTGLVPLRALRTRATSSFPTATEFLQWMFTIYPDFESLLKEPNKILVAHNKQLGDAQLMTYPIFMLIAELYNRLKNQTPGEFPNVLEELPSEEESKDKYLVESTGDEFCSYESYESDRDYIVITSTQELEVGYIWSITSRGKEYHFERKSDISIESGGDAPYFWKVEENPPVVRANIDLTEDDTIIITYKEQTQTLTLTPNPNHYDEYSKKVPTYNLVNEVFMTNEYAVEHFASVEHTHEGYALVDHTHDDLYAPLEHTHEEYATKEELAQLPTIDTSNFATKEELNNKVDVEGTRQIIIKGSGDYADEQCLINKINIGVKSNAGTHTLGTTQWQIITNDGLFTPSNSLFSYGNLSVAFYGDEYKTYYLGSDGLSIDHVDSKKSAKYYVDGVKINDEKASWTRAELEELITTDHTHTEFENLHVDNFECNGNGHVYLDDDQNICQIEPGSITMMDFDASTKTQISKEKVSITGTNAKLEINNEKASWTQAELKSMMLDMFYPVGSIYITMSNSIDNPSELFGGTWEQITNTFLYCAPDAGEEGGSKKITVNNLPAHSHTFTGTKVSTSITPYFVGEDRFGDEDSTATGNAVLENALGYEDIEAGYNSVRTTLHALTLTINDTPSGTISNTGSGTDYMPPYTAVRAWYRTA